MRFGVQCRRQRAIVGPLLAQSSARAGSPAASPWDETGHLKPYVQPTLVPLKKRVLAGMICRLPVSKSRFIMERFAPTEGPIIGRVSLLNPHFPAIRAIQ